MLVVFHNCTLDPRIKKTKISPQFIQYLVNGPERVAIKELVARAPFFSFFPFIHSIRIHSFSFLSIPHPPAPFSVATNAFFFFPTLFIFVFFASNRKWTRK